MARRATTASTASVESTDATNVEAIDDIYQNLMEGTQAHLISDTSKGVLHDRPKVPTPLPHLNALFGGGIPLGSIVEAFGEPACFTGDTRLLLSDGTIKSLEQLYDQQLINIPVYNCSKEWNITAVTAESVYLARYTDELIEIEFGDSIIRCTHDHPFLTVDYRYKRADELTLSDEIVTLNLSCNDNLKECLGEAGVSVTELDMSSLEPVSGSIKPTKISKIKLNKFVAVYGILNAGVCHNYAIALTDTQGVFVSNSGKSSFAYKMMGEFQHLYPKGKGVCIIVDTEASVDSARMHFLGCDPNYMLRIPANTVEKGFEQLFTILDKKMSNDVLRDLPVFILWDGHCNNVPLFS